MNWEQIEKDYKEWCLSPKQITGGMVFEWFKNRIESAQIESAEKLTEEEKSEFYTTNLTADIKANYGK